MKATRMILAVAIVATFTAAAQAGVLFTETFPYAAGELTINDGTGDNVSGGLWVPHSGSTFDDNLRVTAGGHVNINNPGSEDANRLTGATLAAGGKIFASFTFWVTGAAGANVNDDYFAQFKDSGFGLRSRVFTTDVAGGDYTVGIAASGSTINATWPAALTFGTSYRLIHSYDFDTGASELWIDPVSQASLSAFDDASLEATASMEAILSYALRQDFFTSGPDPTRITVDDIVVGDTFGDVIPEPATLALFGLGGLVLLRRRR